VTDFQEKRYTAQEINDFIARQFEIAITPIVQETGKIMRQIIARVEALEAATNTLITEMKEWKEQNTRVIQ
jgi:cytolysin (calcineurin-like family phosphatase)